jgi:hypothetical protein
MSFLELPVRSDLPSYEFTVDLELTNYIFKLRFNVRLDRWIVAVYDEEGEPVLAGVPVQTNLHLFRQYPLTTLPPGAFIAHDDQGFDADPDIDALLGDRVKFIYRESTT